MNVDAIRELISQHFQDVEKIDGHDVFRARQVYKGKNSPVGIYYFDYGQPLLKSRFNLESYQERLLGDEYYDLEGDLQWNLYLYFLCEGEDYAKLTERGLVADIEGDDIYARKHVTTVEDFERELALRSEEWFKQSADLPESISARWMDKLEENELAGAYIQQHKCTEVFRRYMDGDPIAGEVAKPRRPVKEPPRVDFIKGMRLRWQRAYPQQNSLSFGRCNLLHGVNGAGKTSLLEAIELWTCGRTKRNPAADERPESVSLSFDGEQYLRGHTRRDNKIYRERDFFWYGNHYSRGAYLYESFNRFNFYNTDAAVEVSNDSSYESINSALSSLVLGEAANVMKSRLRTLLPYFEQEYRYCEKGKEELQSQIKRLSNELLLLEQAAVDEREIFKQFEETLGVEGWRGAVEKTEPALGSFLQDLDRVSAQLEQCRAELGWLSPLSFASVREEAARVGRLAEEVKNIASKIESAARAVREGEDRLKELTSELSLLDAWMPYLASQGVQRLLRLDETIEAGRRRRELCAQTLDLVAGVNLGGYEDLEAIVSDYEADLSEREREVADAFKKQQTLADELQKQFGRIAALTADIRARSKELAELAPALESCPACGSSFGGGEFYEQVLKQEEKSPHSPLLDASLTRSAESQRILDAVRERLDSLRRIRKAVSLLAGDGAPSELKLSDAVNLLRRLPEEAARLDEQLVEAANLKSRLERDGLDPLGVQRLSRSALRDVDVGEPSLNLQDGLARHRGLLQTDISSLLEDLEGRRAQLSELAAARSARLRDYFAADVSLEEQGAALRNREERLSTFAPVVEAVTASLDLKPEDTLAEASVRLKVIKAAYESYLHARKILADSGPLKGRYEEEKGTYEAQLREKLARRDRAEKALTVIREILEEDEKGYLLEKFFESNRKDIFNIYRLLHAPREFEDITFGEDGNISLIKNTGRKSLLTEVSSGQRSALALSVFLALNRKLQSGPPFILFDDPVALVDDMNVLSFFDYLRNVVIGGERQVFFATASRKIATLFRKKFAFLEDDFQEVPLRR